MTGCQSWFFKQHAQQRRDNLQGANLLSGYCLNQIQAVPITMRTRQNQAGACQQGGVELPYRGIKTERRFLQHPIGCGELEGLLHPEHVVRKASVRNHDALGLSCGA